MVVLRTIGAWVRCHRRLQGLTQAGLAARAGISRGYLSDIERGTRDLSVTVLIRIAAALGL